MTSDILHRLASWRECVRTGKPYWLVELAPIVIAQLEEECAAQGIETRSAIDAKRRGPKGESPVGNADAPKGVGHAQ